MTSNPTQPTPAEPSALDRALQLAERVKALREELAGVESTVSTIRTRLEADRAGDDDSYISAQQALTLLAERVFAMTVERQPENDADGWLVGRIAAIGDWLRDRAAEELHQAEDQLAKLVSPKLTEPAIYDWRRLALWGVKREVAGRSQWATVDVPTESGVSCKAIPLFLGWTDAATAINEWDALKLANGAGLYYVEAATPTAAAFDHANRRDEPASVTLNGQPVEPWRANVFRQAVSDAGLAPAAAIAETPEQVGPLRSAIAVELGLTPADAAPARPTPTADAEAAIARLGEVFEAALGSLATAPHLTRKQVDSFTYLARKAFGELSAHLRDAALGMETAIELIEKKRAATLARNSGEGPLVSRTIEPHPAGAEFSTTPAAEPPLSHWSGVDERLKAGSPEQLDQADRDRAASDEVAHQREAGLQWWAEVHMVPADDSEVRDGHEPERLLAGPYDDRETAIGQAPAVLDLGPGDSFALFRGRHGATAPTDFEIVVVPALPIETDLDAPAPTTTGAGLDVTASEGGAL